MFLDQVAVCSTPSLLLVSYHLKVRTRPPSPPQWGSPRLLSTCSGEGAGFKPELETRRSPALSFLSHITFLLLEYYLQLFVFCIQRRFLLFWCRRLTHFIRKFYIREKLLGVEFQVSLSEEMDKVWFYFCLFINLFVCVVVSAQPAFQTASHCSQMNYSHSHIEPCLWMMFY